MASPIVVGQNRGLPKYKAERSEAVEFWLAAPDQVYTIAHSNPARYYERGLEVQQSRSKTIELLTITTRQGTMEQRNNSKF